MCRCGNKALCSVRSRTSHWLFCRMELPSLDAPSSIRASSAPVSAWLTAVSSGTVSTYQKADDEPPDAALLASHCKAGFGALHYASLHGHEHVLSWLIEVLPKGALNTPSTKGYTALMVAACRSHAPCVVRLLEAGASPWAVDKRGLTCLHYAAASESPEMVRRILTDVSLARAAAMKNRDNSTPLGIAGRVAATATGGRQVGSQSVHRLLEEESKRLKQWFRAARVADIPTMEAMLLVQPGLVRMEDPGGVTALMICARLGRPDAVTTLLERGASVNHADAKRWTVLHHLVDVVSARAGLQYTLRPLLAAGADPLRVDARGNSPFHMLLEALTESRRRGGADAPASTQVLLSELAKASVKAKRWRRLRAIGRTLGVLVLWHRRAVERAYAPGGLGYCEAEADFGERAAKVARYA